MRGKRAILVWGPAAALMALLFLVSSIPGSSPWLWRGGGRAGHVVAYAVLGALLVHAFAGGRWRAVRIGHAAGALLAAVLFGVSDELHQRFVAGRAWDLLDVGADAVGALAGVLFVWACGIVLSIRRPVS